MNKTKNLITMGVMAVVTMTSVMPSLADRFPFPPDKSEKEKDRQRSRDRISYSTNSNSARPVSAQTYRHSGDLSSVERASRLVGAPVEGSDGQRVGQVRDLVADLESGRVLYAVVSANGSGESIAVPPGVFSNSRGSRLTLNVDKQALDNAPKFNSQMVRSDELGQASFIYRVHQHFGQSAWWQGASAPDKGKFNNVHRLSKISGMNVKNVSDQPVGEVNNVMVDLPAGRVPFVVIDPARGLNLGNRYFALPPDALTLSSDQKSLVSDVTRDKLASAPSFTREEWSRLSDKSFAASVYQHYGKQAYFESGDDTGLTPTGRDYDRVYDKDYDRTDRNWDRKDRDRSWDRDSERRDRSDPEHKDWHRDYERDHDMYHRDLNRDRE